MNGRPIAIHSCDMDQEVCDVIGLFNAPFRVWLRITEILSNVIRCYRPHSKRSTDDDDVDIPGLEEILKAMDAWGVQLELLGKKNKF